MQSDNEDYYTFLIGDIRSKENDLHPDEMISAMRAIESIMIEHGIIKIDVSINPFAFPRELLDY